MQNIDLETTVLLLEWLCILSIRELPGIGQGFAMSITLAKVHHVWAEKMR
jgi:hypothetical protein